MAKRKNTNQNNNKKKGSSKTLIFILIIIVAVIGYRKYKSTGDISAVPETVAKEVESTIETISKEAGKKAETIKKETSKAKQKATDAAKKKSEKSKTEKAKKTEKAEEVSTSKSKSAKVYTTGMIALQDELETPVCAGANHAKDHQIRKFNNYAVCYRESYEQAEWSAYKLTTANLKKNSGRTNDFREDPKITTGSATLDDYKGSGYDRGHLTPAADMSFDEKAMSETFYMSNMSPQAGAFNRGIWQQLEAQVRVWTKTFGQVYVVSGPILDKPASKYASIGKQNKVAIPQYYYKVILAPIYENDADKKTPDDAKSVAAIGFILPNDGCSGKQFWDFAVSIDEVEKRTGLDFYSLLDDNVENQVEKSFDISIWK